MSIFDTFLNWKVFVETLPLLLMGLWITIGLGVAAIVLGAAGGLLLALARLYGPAPLRFLAIAYINVFRAIPLLVLLIVIYSALPFVGLRLTSFTSATTYDKAALAALQQEELKLAGVDHGCDLKYTMKNSASGPKNAVSATPVLLR